MRKVGVISMMIFFCAISYCFADSYSDSIQSVVDTTKNDSVKIAALYRLCEIYKNDSSGIMQNYANRGISLSKKISSSNGVATGYNIIGAHYYRTAQYEKAIHYFTRSLRIEHQTDNFIREILSLNNIALCYRIKGEYATSIEYYEKALELRSENKDSSGLAYSFINIGGIYYLQGDFKIAVDYFLQALSINENINNDIGVGMCQVNLGNIYFSQADYNNALEMFESSIVFFEKSGNKTQLTKALGNIGAAYRKMGNHDKATEYYKRSIKLKKELNDVQGISMTLNNLGIMYGESGDYVNSVEYLEEALNIKKEIGDQKGIAETLNNLGVVYGRIGKTDKAIELSKHALGIAVKIGAKELLQNIYLALSEAYLDINDFRKAFDYQKSYTEIKDSLYNEEKLKEIGKLEARYEFKKQLTQQKREDKELARITMEKVSRRNILQYSGILIFLVILGAGVLALGKLNIPVRLAEGMIFFAFLLFFEFALVMLDPYIEQYSSGAPAIKLGFNAIVAALIFPLHSFFEELMKRRIINRK